MTSKCSAPVSDEDLLDYWAHAIAATDAERLEEHLFSCGDCSARLEAMASLGTGLVGLVRRGRVSGVVSRSLLNRMQRDSVQVRQYVMSPGERVPCAAFPGDDLLVVSLRADFAALETVTLSVTGPENTVSCHLPDVPVSGTEWRDPLGDTWRHGAADAIGSGSSDPDFR